MGQPGLHLVEDFINPAVRRRLVNYMAHRSTLWPASHAGDPWSERVQHIMTMPDPIFEIADDIRKRVCQTVQDLMGEPRPLYTDGLCLTRWRPGDEQGPHADKEHADGRPHDYPWRDYGAIIYLNSQYEGGQLYFPRQGLRPRLKPGTLACFPGSLAYLHGVTEVTEGMRYTVALFLTPDKSKSDETIVAERRALTVV